MVPRIWKICFQIWEINGVSRSETMSSGNPWRRTTFAKIRFVVFKSEMALEHGIKCTILVNRSTTTKMDSCPSKSSKSVMKSIKWMTTTDLLVGEVEAVYTGDDGLFWIEHTCDKS